MDFDKSRVHGSHADELHKGDFWHNVKDEKPTHDKTILVCFAKDLYSIGYYSLKNKKFLSNEHYEINPVAWADIPEYK